MAGTTEALDAADDVEPSVGLFKKRGAKAKGNARKRLTTPPRSQSDDSSEEYSSQDESGRTIKRRKKNTGVVTGVSTSNKVSQKDLAASTFDADRNSAITSSNDATKQSNWYDQDSKDALSSKNLLGSTRATKDPQAPDGTYKGLAAPTSFIQKNPNASTRSVGPVKAPTNVRMTTQTDYAPDVCKDYKQTGFCGFGDSCKFLHDRSDYKQGWQLDREWESVTKGKKLAGTVVASANRNQGLEEDEDEDAMLENIPFACIICKGDYKYPIITKCGHYFCENCALQRYRKDPSCAACGQGTNGVFNSAKKLKKLLERKRERELAMAEDSDAGSGNDDE